MLKYLASLLVTVSLSIAVAFGFASPAFAAPYCETTPGPVPGCASVVCIANPDPGDFIEVNETFQVNGFVTPSQCPAEYPTPNYVQLCFPYAGDPYCDADLKPVNPNGTWGSTQILGQRGEREIVSTGYYGPDRVTLETRMTVVVIE